MKTCMKRMFQALFDENEFVIFILNEIVMIRKAKDARVECQYYVTDAIPDPISERMIREAPHFLMKCRSIAKSLDEKIILSLRQNIQKYDVSPEV